MQRAPSGRGGYARRSGLPSGLGTAAGRRPAPGAGEGQAEGQSQAITLPQVDIIGASPLLGSGVDRNTVPAETNVLTGDALTRGEHHHPQRRPRANEKVSGVALDFASGNPYQPTLFYHGYQASPLQGTPQGLAVYVNGVRFNQAFGDTVNLDLLPDMAIDRIDLVGSNPVFGLNALGGALNVQLKNGFTYQGGELELRGGSFGTVDGEFQYGKQSGNTAVYVAGSGVQAGGLARPAIVEWRISTAISAGAAASAELHFNIAAGAFGAERPGDLADRAAGRRSGARSSRRPTSISNQFMQISLSGNVQVSDTISLQAVAYYDYFLQRVPTATRPNDTPCTDGSGLLCNDAGPSTTLRRRHDPGVPRVQRPSPTPSSTTRRRTPTATAPRSRSPTRMTCSA